MVPLLHERTGLVNASEQWLLAQAGLGDELGDSWEHPTRSAEFCRKWTSGPSRVDFRVRVLSGNVHVSAVF